MWKWKPDVEFQYGGRLGEFNGMSSQSHVSHCRVLPLGEFNVTIPQPRATLQGARIPSAISKIVFRHISFVLKFSLGFDERRLSYLSIHLFTTHALGSSASHRATGSRPLTHKTRHRCSQATNSLSANPRPPTMNQR